MKLNILLTICVQGIFTQSVSDYLPSIITNNLVMPDFGLTVPKVQTETQVTTQAENISAPVVQKTDSGETNIQTDTKNLIDVFSKDNTTSKTEKIEPISSQTIQKKPEIENSNQLKPANYKPSVDYTPSRPIDDSKISAAYKTIETKTYIPSGSSGQTYQKPQSKVQQPESHNQNSQTQSETKIINVQKPAVNTYEQPKAEIVVKKEFTEFQFELKKPRAGPHTVIIVGLVAIIAILACLLYCFCQSRCKKQEEESHVPLAASNEFVIDKHPKINVDDNENQNQNPYALN